MKEEQHLRLPSNLFFYRFNFSEHTYKSQRIKSLKENLRSKKKFSSNESVKNAQKGAITDLNAPNGSRDIPFQSQEFEQYGRRHFLHF